MGRGAPCRPQRQDPDLSPALALCEPIACHCPALLLIVWVSRATPPARPGWFHAAPPEARRTDGGSSRWLSIRVPQRLHDLGAAAGSQSRSSCIWWGDVEHLGRKEKKREKRRLRKIRMWRLARGGQESYICACISTSSSLSSNSIAPSTHTREVEHA